VSKLESLSVKRLEAGIHPLLKAVVERAAEYSDVPFRVTDALRTLATQRRLVAQGLSRTLDSRHLTGHAVDLAALLGPGKVSWAEPLMYRIRAAMFRAADELDAILRWGGDWDSDGKTNDQSFHDIPHFELPLAVYGRTNPALDRPAPVVPPRTAAQAAATLAPGRRGDDVRALQTQLNALGAGLVVDGVFGLATDTFLRTFQAANDLTVDGVVGPKTRRMIETRVKAARKAA
jgi:peptidoglycan L-alanyl-D-glutamate endopeptidase CwlK